jgi:hypothetical protein
MSDRHAKEGPEMDECQANPGHLCARAGNRSSEAGYAYIIALAIIVATIIGSQVVLENMITQGRRQREEETIWRGNQWARAIRLYYHKMGHYPQSIDDLETGVPDVHFLRASAIKDPMDPDDGSWRFIYVNATGQIIGSVRYATLQQMAIMDLNNGKIPTAQGSAFPGAVSAASLSSMPSDNSDTGNSPTSSDNSGAAHSASPSPGGGASVGDTNGQNPQGNSPQTPSGSTGNSAGSGGQGQQNSNSNGTPAFGQGQSASTFGSPAAGAQNTTSLAQLAQLKPTGPVDGPVIGGFLSGVGIPTAIDQKSIKIYHGGKKYKDWEFIWNPLEDQAQALRQGLGAAQGQGLLPGQAPSANPFGAIPTGANPTGASTTGSTSPQTSAPQPNQ